MPFYSNYCSAGDEPRAIILKAINMHCTVDHLLAFKKNKHVSQIHLKVTAVNKVISKDNHKRLVFSHFKT